MTSQEYYNLLVSEALAGNLPSLAPLRFHACAFRGEKGRKCVAGHLIPDSVYVHEMEYMPFRTICKKYAEVATNIPTDMTIGQIERLQGLHDSRLTSSYKPDGSFDPQGFIGAINKVFSEIPNVQLTVP